MSRWNNKKTNECLFWNLENRLQKEEKIVLWFKHIFPNMMEKSHWVSESHLACMLRETVSDSLKSHLCTSNLKLNVGCKKSKANHFSLSVFKPYSVYCKEMVLIFLKNY